MLKFGSIRYIVIMTIFCLSSQTASTVSNENDPKEFFKSGVTFGFQGDGVLFGDPEFIGPDYNPENDELLQKYLHDNTPIGTVIGNYELIKLPFEYIDSKIADSPGDTVQIISSGNKIYAVIDRVVYFFDAVGCYQGVECVLAPIDKQDIEIRISGDFVILRRGKFYSGSITPYREYVISGPSYEAIVDSVVVDLANAAMDYKDGKLRNINNRGESDFIRSWRENRQDPSYAFPLIIIESKVYSIKALDMPDTLFLAVYANVEGNTFHGWTALLKLYRSGNEWNAIPLLESHPGWGISIKCSIDLNEDSIPEYFVLIWSGALYTYIDGKMEMVAYAGYSGC
ncbi:MAG: hypothetical protein JSU85_10555 [Candidatus Zixiibacteriota bacterium]|nr:MAG: hypothetical protein JSU85_10555 [candidate division Zixibacteria bacterium]